jgi:hypothetical protein
MKLAIGLAIPLLLILAGMLLLMGCFPVPATKQLQPDLKLRPEHLIGAGSDKFVRLGETSIDDAFIVLSRQVTPEGSERWNARRSDASQAE